MISLIENIIKLIVAVILGILIGYEREKSHKPAGMRTHILVSLGSTLITIVSAYYFPADPARVTAAIIAGIGFLGAGTIIASGRNVMGLTTAASLWVIAAIGITVGMGDYILAFVTALVVLLVLVFGKFERKKIK